MGNTEIIFKLNYGDNHVVNREIKLDGVMEDIETILSFQKENPDMVVHIEVNCQK